MTSIFVDTSDSYTGLIVGHPQIVNEELNKSLQKMCGKPVHMRELNMSTKLKLAAHFKKVVSSLCEEDKIKLICTRKDKAFSWIAKLVKEQFRKKERIPIFYVDVGIDLELREIIHPFYYRLLNVIVDKSLTQCSDVFAWMNLRKNEIRFIWEGMANHVLEIDNVQ